MTEQGGNKEGLFSKLAGYGDDEFAAYIRRSFASSMGYSKEALGRPIVGIANTKSDFNNCHRHFPELVEAVKRGVLMAGGLPMEFPTISLGEVFLHPTSLKFRNLMAMETEEMIRAQPMDAAVLIGGCDKTVPAQLMAAVSAGIPSVQLVAGPMMTGRHKGERLGACTDCRRFWARYRAKEIDRKEIEKVNSRLATTTGTCAVMGTASSMACLSETMGMILPGTAAIPAVHADRIRAAEESGRRAVELIDQQELAPNVLINEKSVENALRVLFALSGSTNAVLHLAAIARRARVAISVDRFNEMSDETPVLVNLKPVGTHYMEDFFGAGGVPAVLHELKHLLHLDCQTVSGKTLGEIITDYEDEFVDPTIIRPNSEPVSQLGGLITVRGNLAPKGAIVKRAAADPDLLEHEGRAVVFTSLDDLAERIDSDDLDVKADDILVLQNAGPCSEAAMPEAGYLPIPKKLAAQGVKDMVRISDARMSGTAYGTIVLHVTPEASIGGPLAAVRNGDRIRLSADEKRIDLLISDEALAQRLANLDTKPQEEKRGYSWLYSQHILQADEGADFDFC